MSTESYTLLPNHYGWVLLAVNLTFLLNVFQVVMVTRLRRKYAIAYPKMVSEDHDDFNRAQRAHQNTMEFTPFVLVNLALAGLGFPIYAAGFGVGWVFGRIIFSIGYYTDKPKVRLLGFFFSLVLGLMPLGVLTNISGVLFIIRE